MQYAGLSQDDLRAQYEDEAEKRVKIRLALEKIAEIENIEADDEALEEEYSKIAEQYKMELDQVKSLIPASELKKDVAVSKAMDFVKENANIK